MEKRIIDQFKGSEREIDLMNNTATINGKVYFIKGKTFDKGILSLKLSYYEYSNINDEFVINFELKNFTTKRDHYRIALSTINKSDTFITRLKNRIKIIKYFLLN